MRNLQRDEAAAEVRHAGCRMRTARPLDDRRERAVEWHRTVGRNGDQPFELTARHHDRGSGGVRHLPQRRFDVIGGDDPR
jgi:hypothetical protein